MKFPQSLSRAIGSQALNARKNAPNLLFGAGVTSMLGSTVMACRATLKVEKVLEDIKTSRDASDMVLENHPDRYSEMDHRQDSAIIHIRGAVSLVKLYAPAILLGGLGIACLTKSHIILKERNTALVAAYLAVDKAFQKYRERVVEQYGERVDRDMRYGSEDVDIVDEETGKVISVHRADTDELPSGYARWFDGQSTACWTAPPYGETYNLVFLRSKQNELNDLLHARGHLFLNEAYAELGMTQTSAGAIVGWIHDRRQNIEGDNYVDFGCWNRELDQPDVFYNGRDGSILLDFNVDGPIWDLIDKQKEDRGIE